MLEYCFACSFKWILSVAGSYVDDCFRCAYRGLDRSLTLRVFSHEAQYFLIMICELFDELFIMMFFSAHVDDVCIVVDAETRATVGLLFYFSITMADFTTLISDENEGNDLRSS